jgi:flagellin
MAQGLSVNANVGAMVALQQLNLTNKKMQNTQLRITSGLKVNGPKDDGSTFAIATRLRGDIAGTKSVGVALASGNSTVDVAISAGKAIADVLVEMKAKTVQANQAGLDTASRSSLQTDFAALRTQLDTIVASAEFNQANLIFGAASTLNVLSTVEGSVIAVSGQKMDSTTLVIHNSTLGTSAAAVVALASIETAIVLIGSKLAALGSAAKTLEIQGDFTVSLVNILTEGLGNLVDADLAQESATLQALQIQQQLGVQALSIANSAPQSILGLFQ